MSVASIHSLETPVGDASVAQAPVRRRPRLSDEVVRRLLVHARVHKDREAQALIAPFSGEALCQVPVGSADDVVAAAQSARLAQERWAATAFAERARVFVRYHDLILKRREEICDIIQAETGKARRYALEEVLDAALVARHYAYHGARMLRRKRRKGALPGLTETWEYRQPLGVIGIVGPWNYPLSLTVTDAIPALLAGNAVVLKPDQQTPLSALWGVDLLLECGLPQDLFQIVTGRGRELGTPLIESTDYLSFTGSTETGRGVAAQAAQRLIGCSAELGGKNPMIVLEDADLRRTTEGALRACFANSGQLCISIERMYVQRAIWDAFVPRFAEAVQNIKLGSGFDLEIEMGSLVSRAQLDKITEHVADAVQKGATVLAGGKPRPDLGPFFFEPTVLTGVTPEMKVYAEETFGPLVSVYAFDTHDEAVQRANDTPYGLNASVWTRNTHRGVELASRIQAGSVNVNEGYAATFGSVDAPMGGFKASGLGRRHGDYGLLKYTEAQTISVQHLWGITPPPGVTYPRFAGILTALVRLMRHLPGIR